MARLTVVCGVMALTVLGGVSSSNKAAAQEGVPDGTASGTPTVPLAPPAPNDSTSGDPATGSLPPEPSSKEQPPVLRGRVPEESATESAQPKSNGAPAETRTENDENRFTFSRMNDGYVRLDNRTGQVSFCSKRTVGWTCQLAAEDRGVLENEITRLQGQNATLKKELLTRGLPLPDSMKVEPPAQPPVARNESTLSTPSDPSIERMRAMVERAWRQLVDMIAALQRDVLKKS